MIVLTSGEITLKDLYDEIKDTRKEFNESVQRLDTKIEALSQRFMDREKSQDDNCVKEMAENTEVIDGLTTRIVEAESDHKLMNYKIYICLIMMVVAATLWTTHLLGFTPGI